MSETKKGPFDEVLGLLDTVQQKVARRVASNTIRGVTGVGTQRGDDVWAEVVNEPPDVSAECRYCPICRARAAARDAGPDVVDHLAAAGGSVIAALRDMVTAYDRSGPPRRSGRGDNGDDNDQVEHIDLR